MYCEKCNDFTSNEQCSCKLYKYRHVTYTDNEWTEKYARTSYDLVENILTKMNEDDPDTSGEAILDEPIEIINEKGIIEKWNGSCELMLVYDCWVEEK